MTDIFNLSGKVAIVTGARTGIGQGIAEGLAEAGCDVVGAGHAAMPETEAYIKNLGRKFLFYDIDLVNQDKIQALVDETIKTFGRLDILVNNAGIIRREDVLDFSEKNWDDVISMNLKSLFFLSQAAARYMKDNGGGKIINIASMYGLVGNKVAPCSPYHAAKGGVVNMTRGLAAEWGKYNVNVNAICPGYFYSPLTKETLDSDFFQQNAQTMIPLSRYGNEGELDTAALFLASPASSYVTGVILPVDGGYTAM